jgi:dihydroxyacetone kinase
MINLSEFVDKDANLVKHSSRRRVVAVHPLRGVPLTYVFNTEASFKDDALAGFVNAYSRYVELVPGVSAVQQVGGAQAGKVSVIGGGGSGHYPAFCGFVGQGLLSSAVVGNVFASPSAEQAYQTGWALDAGVGVLFAVGNYAGDVLNFEQAQHRLVSDGVDCRCLFVTDDVASASPKEVRKRRGIAGDLIVFKIAGAAADAGQTLDEVERIARKANDATRSFGVAFDGCTLPGRQEKLFAVQYGQMDIGLGIHGEPGIRSVEWMPASGLALLLLEPILAERPESSDGRIAVLLNGLGATKYEELFVLWSTLCKLFDAAGLQVVLPEVGELVTSLDMAGCSLTLTWLDDELAALWSAPCDAPGFRRGQVVESVGRRATPKPIPRSDEIEQSVVNEESLRAASCVREALTRMLDAMIENEAELGRLDSVAGDGDHGVGMVRGLRAAVAASGAQTAVGVSAVLSAAGRAWADAAGGTSGVLWGVLLGEMGAALDEARDVSGLDIADSLRRGTAQLQSVGGGKLGDKTMLDVLVPFVDELDREFGGHGDFVAAWTAAASKTSEAAASTANLTPRIGRARPLAERSVGSPDPGAVSMSLCLIAAGVAIAELYTNAGRAS